MADRTKSRSMTPSSGGYSMYRSACRNVSKIGAALEVASPVGIPDRFTLVVPREGLQIACRVIYRKERRIGVKFHLTCSPKGT
jgi:hypothetical protein